MPKADTHCTPRCAKPHQYPKVRRTKSLKLERGKCKVELKTSRPAALLKGCNYKPVITFISSYFQNEAQRMKQEKPSGKDT